MAIPFVVARLLAARDRITTSLAAISAAPAAAVVLGWVLLYAYERVTESAKLGSGAGGLATQIADRGSAWFTAAFIAAVLAGSISALWLEVTSRDRRGERESVIFALALIATAMLLILGTEFFYVGDVFNNRMNTVFKLYYQAWMLLAIGGAFALYYLTSRWRPAFPQSARYRAAWGAAAALVLAGAALYPLGAGFNRTHDVNGTRVDPAGALHGIHYYSADERAAIDWLDERAQGQDVVIAEAVGNDYTAAGRISGATGIPTILGWQGHEDQWREGKCKACAGRFEDVSQLYRSTDASVIAPIVKKYGVTYVYVGDLERTTYAAGIEKFKSLQVAFQSGAVTIYRAKGVTGEVEAAQ
jgi:uncharacterized membrane protein